MSDMRERVLTAAVDVVRTQGLAAATTREVGRAAGVPDSCVSEYFPTDQDLVRAVLSEGIGNPLPDVIQRLWTDAGAGDLRARLADVAIAAVRFYREVLPLSGPQLTRPRDAGQAGPALPALFGPIIGHEALARYLAIEQRLGRIRPGVDPAILALSLLGSCQYYACLTLTSTVAQLDDAAGLTSDPDAMARRIVAGLIEPAANRARTSD